MKITSDTITQIEKALFGTPYEKGYNLVYVKENWSKIVSEIQRLQNIEKEVKTEQKRVRDTANALADHYAEMG
jgi:hypothetical protein